MHCAGLRNGHDQLTLAVLNFSYRRSAEVWPPYNAGKITAITDARYDDS